MRAELLIRHANLATLAEAQGFGECIDGAVVVAQGRIAWVGADRDLPATIQADREFDAQGAWLTPALIDCHTHVIWAGSRANEFEQRLHGASYQDIARAGGGIASSVRATRAADEAELVRLALPRAKALRAEGVTTLEIKSGYGLERDTELRMLRAARALGQALDLRIKTTLLAAHALPPEFVGRADDYVTLICEDILPAAHAAGLVDAVDAFCEGIGFTLAQTRRVFEAARALGLPVKLHADQLSDLGGAALAAEFGGLSADHVEYTSDASIAAMARAGTVAVLLPGAFYCLRETRVPPIEGFRARGVPMALSTDCNPGTSPCTSLLLMLHMACTFFRLTPAEALAGVTRHAARALGLQAELGQLRVGYQADVALWAVEHPRDLAAYFGRNPLSRAWREGREQV